MSAIVRCVEKPLFLYALMLDFVYEMIILMSEHIHNRNTVGGGGYNKYKLLL